MDNQSSAANDLPARLSADVFHYFSAKSPEALSSFVELLIRHGDMASLHAGLEAGGLDGIRIDAAVKHCAAVLLIYSDKAESSNPANRGQAEMQMAEDWIKRRVERYGAIFTEQIVSSLMDRADESRFRSMFALLKKPSLGLELGAEMELSEAEAQEFGDDEPRFSLLGRIADHHRNVALDLLGPTVERFPNTAALPPMEGGNHWVPLNLAEQVTLEFSDRAPLETIERLLSMAPAGSPAQRQLEEVTLALLANGDQKALRQREDFSGIAAKTERLADFRAETSRSGVMLIGSGVEISNPDLFWGYVRESKVHAYMYEDESIRGHVPLAHTVLHIDPDLCTRELATKALQRMIIEGGVPVDVKDSRGFTLLQAAASAGHEEAVGMLLKLEVDHALDHGSENRKAAVALAEISDQTDIAKMILAHEAQAAIHSVLAKNKFTAHQPG